jgi:Zn-dependent protease
MLDEVMKWSWKLGRFAGIDTYVHASFLLLVAWSAWASWSGAGTGLAVVMGVGFLLAVFGSVLLHELGHALTARRFGVRTRRIVLSPIGGIAQLEGMPRRPRQELAVALAGPAVNFAIAAALWLVTPAFAGAGHLATFLGSITLANLGLGLFNLIPAFPMDGGRALRALLAERVGTYRATEVAAKIGKGIALVMGVAAVVWGPFMLALVAAFVWFAANAEQQASRAEAYLGGSSWRAGSRRSSGLFGGSRRSSGLFGGSRRSSSAWSEADDVIDPHEVEVLGAPARRRDWTDVFGTRPTRRDDARSWEARRVYEAMRPVRVVLVRRGWF